MEVARDQEIQEMLLNRSCLSHALFESKRRARQAEARANAAEARADESFARESAKIQLQDALDRASSSETRAREAQIQAAALESQLTLQTHGMSSFSHSFIQTFSSSFHQPSHFQLTIVWFGLVCFV